MKYIAIAVGGAAGALLRYSASGLAVYYFKGIFPWGTLIVNLSGAFLVGLSWGIFEGSLIDIHWRYFIFIGLLGGFTTFSSFCLENLNLMKSNETSAAMANILISNVGGLVLVFSGYMISKWLLTVLR
ncbi:MAG: fluoride efflux transporter CrcB [Candidatus Omnitrophica bacterium]|nr:fluoride efflux transporter CrcB [Candidatus Omnitrophota bacterium]